MTADAPPDNRVPAPADRTATQDDPSATAPDDRAATAQVLTAEYGLLMAALGAAWSASLVRTSIFLMTLSATGVALGFAAQDRATFSTLALVLLPVVLFLGVATFIRLVQVQRESIVYVTGLNRIRHFFQELAPASRRYYVLPAHDDQRALYRSIGTGMSRHQPRFLLLYLVVQTQGIVGVVTALVAGAVVGLALAPQGVSTAWVGAGLAFVATVGVLFLYWQRSLNELRRSIDPRFPTPPEEVETPF